MNNKRRKMFEIALRRRLIRYFMEQHGVAGCLMPDEQSNRWSKWRFAYPKAYDIAGSLPYVTVDEIEDVELRHDLKEAKTRLGLDPRTNDGKAWSGDTITRDLEALRDGKEIDSDELVDTSLSDAHEACQIMLLEGRWSGEERSRLTQIEQELHRLIELRRLVERAEGAQKPLTANDDDEARSSDTFGTRRDDDRSNRGTVNGADSFFSR